MGKFFRNKKEIIFWLISITLFVVLAFAVIKSATFLSSKAFDAFGVGLLKDEGPVKFNLDKLDDLNK